MCGTVPEVVLEALSVVQVCSVLSEKALGREELSAELGLELLRVRVSVVSLVKGRGSVWGRGGTVMTSRLHSSSSVGGGVSWVDGIVGWSSLVEEVLLILAISIVAGGVFRSIRESA